MSFWLGIAIGWLIGVFGTVAVLALCAAASERRTINRINRLTRERRRAMGQPDEAE